jgi:hypothetical protein
MFVVRRSAAVAVAVVIAVIGVQTGLPFSSSASHRVVAEAGGGDPFADGDNDMVPDCIEMLAQTDPASADSDKDGIDDFEEILTFTSHEGSLKPAPVEYAMRVLITSTPRPSGQTDVYLHLMMRFVNLTMSQVAFEDFYVNVRGENYSLLSVLGYGNVRVRQRHRTRDGVSYLFSIRMSSVADLQRITPCTIGARAVLGGKRINAGSLIMSTGTDMAAVLPYKSVLILQPVSTAVYIQDHNPYYRGGGRVCEMGLTTVGTSRRGTLCEVDWAKCRVAAGLRCSSTCSTRVGTTVVIPDGLGTITGGR